MFILPVGSAHASSIAGEEHDANDHQDEDGGELISLDLLVGEK